MCFNLLLTISGLTSCSSWDCDTRGWNSWLSSWLSLRINGRWRRPLKKLITCNHWCPAIATRSVNSWIVHHTLRCILYLMLATWTRVGRVDLGMAVLKLGRGFFNYRISVECGRRHKLLWLHLLSGASHSHFGRLRNLLRILLTWCMIISMRGVIAATPSVLLRTYSWRFFRNIYRRCHVLLTRAIPPICLKHRLLLYLWLRLLLLLWSRVRLFVGGRYNNLEVWIAILLLFDGSRSVGDPVSSPSHCDLNLFLLHGMSNWRRSRCRPWVVNWGFIGKLLDSTCVQVCRGPVSGIVVCGDDIHSHGLWMWRLDSSTAHLV